MTPTAHNGLWENCYEVSNLKNKILMVLSHILVALIATAATLFIIVGQMPEGYSKLDQLEDLITEKFIGEADKTVMEDAAASAMVDALGDQWSYYISAADYGAYMEQMKNAYVGVGITVQAKEDGTGLEVMSVTAGGPAEEAKIQVGDVIVGVEGERIEGQDVNNASAKIKGEEGTPVSLLVLRDGKELTISVMRRQIQVPVTKWQMLEGNTGLITIENFDARCASETIAAIEELTKQGATKLIFDVRNNPGGYKDELVDLLDYLLPKGLIFRSEYYNGKVEDDNSDSKELNMPMAVLVNANSYSAAEFFPAALRDYDKAVVVGEQTCGKGYFQNTYLLNDGSAVGLSIGKYYTPKGVSLAGVGVTPDIPVEVDEETYAKIYYDMLEPMDDPQILAAIDALKDK